MSYWVYCLDIFIDLNLYNKFAKIRFGKYRLAGFKKGCWLWGGGYESGGGLYYVIISGSLLAFFLCVFLFEYLDALLTRKRKVSTWLEGGIVIPIEP